MQKFIADRTRTLAALSHDLRTPLTSMRLRIELLPDSPDKDQLLSTLEEMQQMSEATLSFLREASDKEESRRVDLNALLSSLCDDMTDLGLAVSYEETSDLVVQCRLISLKRALRNLIENGVKYGDQVNVSMDKKQSSVSIQIQDHGPGIPESRMEQMFEPFTRMEASRNRDSGGIGLGLAIARNNVRSHGGDVYMKNNDTGLLITIELPLE
nr:ATP-binding protein [Endozoicomonas sp. OPT23]